MTRSAGLEALLRRRFADGLTPGEEAELRAALREDDGLRTRYDALAAAVRGANGRAPDDPTDEELAAVRRRVLAELGAAAASAAGDGLAARGGRRLAGRAWRRAWVVVATAATAAAALAFALRTTDGSDDVRLKGLGAGGRPLGAVDLRVWAVADGTEGPMARRVSSGDRVRLGEYLQVEARALEGGGALRVIGIDASGTVHEYLPRAAGRSIRLGVRHALGPLRVRAFAGAAAEAGAELRLELVP